jgi:hypothetical protein
VFGRGFWDDLAADATLSASFDGLMNAQIAEEAPGVAQAYDWSSLSHLFDLGGGDGTLLAAILTAHPALTGILLAFLRRCAQALSDDDQVLVAEGRHRLRGPNRKRA